jgi:hypothetical protein
MVLEEIGEKSGLENEKHLRLQECLILLSTLGN